MNLMTSAEVCAYLEIKPNNLYQLQHRKILVWVEKKGKVTFYNREDVEALKVKRVKIC